MVYQKCICHINKKDLNIISNYFFNHGCLGIEIKEKIECYERKYGEIYSIDKGEYPQEGVILEAFFTKIDFHNSFDQFLIKNKIKLLDTIKFENIEVYEDNYRYKNNFEEIIINDKITIIPPWVKYSDRNKKNIIIDPGTGFGTGRHKSTQLAIKNLITYFDKDDIMLDFGTGSGILAIIGKKMGIKKVYAIDIDALALKNAKRNMLLNDVDIIFENKSIECFKHKVSLIVANIVYEILVNTLNDIKRVLVPNGLYILSGIISKQKEKMLKMLEKNNFQILDVLEECNWISIVVKLKK